MISKFHTDIYLRRVIRPRVKSYGENSMATLSPSNTLMLCVRILPDKYPMTSVLTSSSNTLNMVLGRISCTRPSMAMVSSLAIYWHQSPTIAIDVGSVLVSKHKAFLFLV